MHFLFVIVLLRPLFKTGWLGLFSFILMLSLSGWHISLLAGWYIMFEFELWHIE